MNEIKKIVGLLNNGEASGDADGEQQVICLMGDNTLRTAVLPYQEKAAYIRGEPSTEEAPWYFNEWSNCYNLVLEDKGFWGKKRFNIKNVPIATIKNLDNAYEIEDWEWEERRYTLAKIKENEYILIDLSDYE